MIKSNPITFAIRPIIIDLSMESHFDYTIFHVGVANMPKTKLSFHFLKKIS